MQKVLLRDGRIKEFKSVEQAKKYAEITSGTLVDKAPAKKIIAKLKQFWERT